MTEKTEKRTVTTQENGTSEGEKSITIIWNPELFPRSSLETSGLEPNEVWWIWGARLAIAGKYRWRRSKNESFGELAKLLSQMRLEGLIENFDFGKVFYAPGRGLPPEEIKDTTAIFFTPASPKGKEVISRIFELEKQETEERNG